MERVDFRGAQILVLLGLATSGCAAPVDTQAGTGTPNVEVAGHIYGDLLHAVDLGDEHVIAFYDYGDNTLGVRESSDADMAEPQVLDAVKEGMTLVEIFKMAVPDAREIPQKLIDADYAYAHPPAPSETEVLPTDETQTDAVAVTSQALQNFTVGRPTTACSSDKFGDSWGAQWFLNNYYNEGAFRSQVTNWLSVDTDEIRTNWFRAKQMEGDYNNVGHTSGWHRWTPTGCWGTCLKESKMVWDYDILPRKVEQNLISSLHPKHYAEAWGWSACNHLHFVDAYNAPQ